MDDSIGVKKGESKSDIVANIDLNVEGTPDSTYMDVSR